MEQGLGLAAHVSTLAPSEPHVDQALAGAQRVPATASPGEAQWHAQDASPRKRHVLVVEDEEPIRHILAALLEDTGYAVSQAADGFEALRIVRDATPDVIVLDLMLP